MGKKSRKKRAPMPTLVSGAAAAALADESLPEWSSLPVPKEGWGVELQEAKSLLKKDPKDTSRALRHCQALFVMRQWEKLEKAATTALETISEENDLSTFKKAQAIAKKHMMIQSALDTPEIQEYLKEVFRHDANVDKNILDQQTFSNLNFIQNAAISGDIVLLEKMVALGAAIDHPSLEGQFQRAGQEPAPPTCTALVLACTSLAQYGVIGNAPGLMTPQLKRVVEGNLECAIQLVRLGADCQAKLIIPANSRGMAASMWRQFKLNNKTAQELAVLSGKRELIKTMEQFQDKDAHELVHCRCGSRLPWKDCHLGGLGKDVPITHKDSKESRICYRYSPLAPCWCKLTKKTHFDCCWYSADPRYQNDKDGSLVGSRIIASGQPGGDLAVQALAQLARARIAEGAGPNDKIFDAEPGEMRTETAKMIRAYGLGPVLEMSVVPNKIRKMDPEVCAGCLERIPNYFFWRDDHWQLEKAELLQRVTEWNEALDKYCDEKGLAGKRREEVMELHRASPLAPCANPSCNVHETKVKEFQQCSRCRTVAYCSRSCQSSHWKSHRKGCIQR